MSKLARLTGELDETRTVAHELADAILPRPRAPFPGLRVAVHYLPASSACEVGGDWCLVAPVPGGKVMISIGDAAGHGLAAVPEMTKLSGGLGGLAVTGLPPDQLVGWLNELVHHFGPERTASALVGFFDPPGRILTWAQAGHPPPVLVRGGSAALVSPPDGILLGAAREPYRLATIALQPGDLLLLYTDGLIERRNRPVGEGLAMLVGAARGASALVPAVARVVRALSAGHPEDDSCLVALQVT
jgi:serine phosphatase RsbU (regulator of sigma subunit)